MTATRGLAGGWKLTAAAGDSRDAGNGHAVSFPTLPWMLPSGAKVHQATLCWTCSTRLDLRPEDHAPPHSDHGSDSGKHAELRPRPVAAPDPRARARRTGTAQLQWYGHGHLRAEPSGKGIQGHHRRGRRSVARAPKSFQLRSPSESTKSSRHTFRLLRPLHPGRGDHPILLHPAQPPFASPT